MATCRPPFSISLTGARSRPGVRNGETLITSRLAKRNGAAGDWKPINSVGFSLPGFSSTRRLLGMANRGGGAYERMAFWKISIANPGFFPYRIYFAANQIPSLFFFCLLRGPFPFLDREIEDAMFR